MNIRYIMLIVVLSFIGFVIWSLTDTVCRPCIIPPDAPDNYACVTSCIPEPRWYSWFR